MGLTISYSGRFKEKESLSNMIEEVIDVATSYKWKFHILKKEFDNEIQNIKSADSIIYGICFSPPGSEPIALTFDSNRRLQSIIFTNDEYNSVVNTKKQHTIFSKTQYAGMEAHKIVIDLLRYLSSKYFSEFKLVDESHYWETEDEDILKANFEKYDKLMDEFAKILEDIPKNIKQNNPR